MKNFLRYPRTTAELNKMLVFLDRNLQDILKLQDKKLRSREWMRICQAINTVRKDALDKIKESNDEYSKAKKSLSIISLATSTINHNFHNKIINIIDKWMKANKIPIS